MKKKAISWMTVMLTAFVCVGFAACGGGSDDDDNARKSAQEEVSDPANPLVGTWYASWTNPKGHETFIFRADGTGNDSGVNDEDSSNPYRWNNNFRYVILGYDTYLNSGKIYLIYSDGSITWDFKLSNSALEFKGATFRKK